jgi:hypothetical protein
LSTAVKPTGLVLDATNSRFFRPREQTPKHALVRWEPMEYTLSWGTQRFRGPHVVVFDPAGHYGVELQVFFATHRAVPHEPNRYIKVVNVRAMCLFEETVVVTNVNGSIEMTAVAPAGAWVVRNPTGEQYVMSAEEFESRYELDERPGSRRLRGSGSRRDPERALEATGCRGYDIIR